MPKKCLLHSIALYRASSQAFERGSSRRELALTYGDLLLGADERSPAEAVEARKTGGLAAGPGG